MFRENKKELTSLRCYDCNYEFKAELNIEDNISDLDCSNCHKNTVEVNYGVKDA